MANKNQVTLTLAGDASDLQKAFAEASNASKEMGDAARTGGKETEKGFSTATFSAVGLVESLSNMAGVVDSVRGAFRAGAMNASRLARAENDLEQVSLDLEQAQLDLEQSARDASQAQLDLRQATRDTAQSELDAEQAAIDLEEAQRDHTESVKEFGKNSIEAKQALLDQKQAQEDLKQAQLDGKQAQEDASQATLDGKQATMDGEQAMVDAKGAQLDMAAAQREVTDASGWSGWLDTVAQTGPALLGALSAVSALRDAVRSDTVAKAANTVATKVATVAQRALNFAMRMNPIGLVITAIAALVAIIITAWKKSETFKRIVTGAFNAVKSAAMAVWNWIKDNWKNLAAVIFGPFGIAVRIITANWDKIKAGAKAAIRGIKSVLSGLGNAIAAPFRWAFGQIKSIWNSILGGKGFSVNLPFGLPDLNVRIPRLHTGGVVPGAPGQESMALLQAGERVTKASSQPRTVMLQSDGSAFSDLIMDTLRNAVRAQGGDVQLVLGQG